MEQKASDFWLVMAKICYILLKHQYAATLSSQILCILKLRNSMKPKQQTKDKVLHTGVFTCWRIRPLLRLKMGRYAGD